MNHYLALRHAHIALVILSLVLFNARFLYRAAYPQRTLARLWRILPHVVDTILLLTGVALAFTLHAVPFTTAPWLGMKLILLVCYVLVGARAMRAQPRTVHAWWTWLLALACVACMVSLAHWKPYF